ncbi:hypothetical protein ABET51_11285 [Metabacillus fastidiosus]|nr:hypothetical protein [Metabacillus fastidiosus]
MRLKFIVQLVGQLSLGLYEVQYMITKGIKIELCIGMMERKQK